jgi:hypothetical protein
MPASPDKEQLTQIRRNGASSPVRKAFLSAPSGVDTTTLQKMLARQGIESFFADEISLPGSTLAEALRESMAAADLVILVLDPKQNNSNVFLELGVALGLRKRVLVLAPMSDLLPGIDLSGIPVIRASLHDLERIEFALRQILAAPQKKDRPGKKRPRKTHPIGNRADELLKELTPDIDSQHLAELVWKALAESGVTTTAETNHKEDIRAVWSDDLAPWVSNPLPIEIRAMERDPKALEGLIEQFTKWLEARGAAWGLLLHSGTLTGTVQERLKNSPVLAISAEKLFAALKKEGFADIVRRLRNDRFHGRD